MSFIKVTRKDNSNFDVPCDHIDRVCNCREGDGALNGSWIYFNMKGNYAYGGQWVKETPAEIFELINAADKNKKTKGHQEPPIALCRSGSPNPSCSPGNPQTTATLYLFIGVDIALK